MALSEQNLLAILGFLVHMIVPGLEHLPLAMRLMILEAQPGTHDHFADVLAKLLRNLFRIVSYTDTQLLTHLQSLVGPTAGFLLQGTTLLVVLVIAVLVLVLVLN